MTLDAANELSRTDTILLPTCALQTRPPSPPTHPTFPTPPLRASSIIFVRARQPLSLSLSVLLRDGGGETWRVEMGKTCFPIHRSGQEGRKSAGGIRRLPQTQD